MESCIQNSAGQAHPVSLIHLGGDRAPKSIPGGARCGQNLGKSLGEFLLPGKESRAGAEGAGPRVESGHAFQGSANWERVWRP